MLVGDQHAFQGDLEPRAIAADRKRLGLAEGRDERLHVCRRARRPASSRSFCTLGGCSCGDTPQADTVVLAARREHQIVVLPGHAVRAPSGEAIIPRAWRRGRTYEVAQ